MVMDVSKLARETAVACGPREAPLLANLTEQCLYHKLIKSLFTSFTRCLQQIAFSGSEEALEEEISSVSQLVSSPAGYRIRDSKQHGPVCCHNLFLYYYLFRLLFNNNLLLFLLIR